VDISSCLRISSIQIAQVALDPQIINFLFAHTL
jgi:hypothetical protein